MDAFASALEHATAVRRREVTARELVDLYLGRIERLNPSLNAFYLTTPELARQQAEGSPDGPLSGLLNALTFRFLAPIRRTIPPIGGTLDLSPLIVIVLAPLLLMLPVTWLESTLTRAFI